MEQTTTSVSPPTACNGVFNAPPSVFTVSQSIWHICHNRNVSLTTVKAFLTTVNAFCEVPTPKGRVRGATGLKDQRSTQMSQKKTFFIFWALVPLRIWRVWDGDGEGGG